MGTTEPREVTAPCSACRGEGYIYDVERIGTRLKQVAGVCQDCGGLGLVVIALKESEVKE